MTTLTPQDLAWLVHRVESDARRYRRMQRAKQAIWVGLTVTAIALMWAMGMIVTGAWN